MDITDPVTRIREDRSQARRQDDPNANICFLALADTTGEASVRTLVLRDITDNRFLLFVNRSSPKWRILMAGGSYQLLLWYSSMQRQYRVSGDVRVLDPEVVKHNWQRRPLGSKVLDLYYENVGDQSTYVESRAGFIAELGRIKQSYQPESIPVPEKAAGLELIATHIEMLDLNRDRRMFAYEAGAWTQQTMVP
jgi:pyridoxamine 5'-phosphate oxidase